MLLISSTVCSCPYWSIFSHFNTQYLFFFLTSDLSRDLFFLSIYCNSCSPWSRLVSAFYLPLEKRWEVWGSDVTSLAIPGWCHHCSCMLTSTLFYMQFYVIWGPYWSDLQGALSHSANRDKFEISLCSHTEPCSAFSSSWRKENGLPVLPLTAPIPHKGAKWSSLCKQLHTHTHKGKLSFQKSGELDITCHWLYVLCSWTR